MRVLQLARRRCPTCSGTFVSDKYTWCSTSCQNIWRDEHEGEDLDEEDHILLMAGDKNYGE